MSDKVRSIRSEPSGESPAAREYRREALAAASELLDAMFDGADDVLFAMAQRSDKTSDHALHFDAMRAVRLERPRISRTFFDELGNILVHGPGSAGTASSSPEELDLMKPEELEESVAVANMANKTTGANRTLIAALEARLATLAEKNALAADGISPIALCHAFKQAMSPVDLEIGVKLLIYKLYDYALADRLQSIYVDLIELLDRHKVAPKSAPAQKRRAKPAPRRDRPADRWTRRLADARRAIAPESHYGIGEILDSLEALENQQALDDAQALLGALVEHLRDRQDDAIPRNLQRDTRMLLARVTTMFRELLEDTRIRPPIRPLLERLRLPLLKTAILDSGFFRDAEHPARQLVNELATLDVAANDPFAVEAEDLVNRLVDGFDDNPDLLETVAMALCELSRRWEREKGDGQANRAARIARSKRMAMLELRQQTLGRHLPAQAKPFLLKAWGPFVAVQYMRFGANSREWREAATMLTRILDELQPPDGPGRGAARRPGQTALLKEVRQRLEGVAIDEARLKEALMSLEKAFETANAMDPPRPTADEVESLAELASWNPDEEVLGRRGRREAGPPPTTAPSERGEKKKEEPTPAPRAVPEELDDDAITRLLTIACKPGMWFQLHAGGARAMRWLKFSCYDRNSGMVYFVNRDGERVFERPAAAFASDLDAGRSRPIYDAEQFERRLADIIGKRPPRPGD